MAVSEERDMSSQGQGLGKAAALTLLFVTTFLLRMTGNMLQTTIPLFGQDYLNLDPATIGTASALFMAAGIVSPLIVVSRMSVEGISRALVVFSALFAAAVPLFYLVSTLITFYALILLASIAPSTVMLLMLTSSQTMQPGHAHATIGIYTVALSSSLVFGPLFEGATASHYADLRPVFIAFFPLVLVSSALLSLRHYSWSRRKPAGTGGPHAIPTLIGARRLFALRSFMLPTLGQMSYSIVFASVLAFGGILAEERIGAGYGEVFLLFGAFFAASWITRIVLTLAPDTSRKVVLLHISILISLVGVVMISYSNTGILMFASFAVLGIPHGLQYPVSAMIIAERTDVDRLPVANALFSSAGAVPLAVTPIAIGYLSTYFGLATAFLLMALPVVALWVFFRIVEHSFEDGIQTVAIR